MDFQTNPSSSETKLCSSCKQFYGNSHTEFLCSKCFKSKKNEGKPSKPSVETEKNDINTIEEEPKVLENTTTVSQTDSSKCWNCQRKVGFLGYKCKCNYTFCKLHRLPEEHDCNFDFKTLGKDRLKEANPLVKASKLEKI